MSSSRDNRRGIFSLLGAMALFAANDTLTKVVLQSYPVGEVMFLRGLLTAIFVALAIVALRQTHHIRRAVIPLVGLRSVFDATASGLFIAALAHMGVAELSAVILASPILMTMLAVFLFKEPVGWRRWAAIIVGLVGTLCVVKPDAGALNLWALAGVAAALCVAARDLTTLRIDASIPTLVVSLFSAFALTIGGFLLGIDEQWKMLAAVPLLITAMAAAFYSLANFLLILAFRSVEVSVVSPFRYSLILWGGIGGYIGFGEIPDGWSILGAALVVASGVYTLHRESVRRRYLSSKIAAEL